MFLLCTCTFQNFSVLPQLFTSEIQKGRLPLYPTPNFQAKGQILAPNQTQSEKLTNKQNQNIIILSEKTQGKLTIYYLC